MGEKGRIGFGGGGVSAARRGRQADRRWDDQQRCGYFELGFCGVVGG